jgi:hypothetical protein
VDEVELQAGPYRPVTRIGDTVRRPAGWWSVAVHDLLAHLAAIGFDPAPKPLGFDDRGREVLSYIDGESGRATFRHVIDDRGLQAFARLLRRYHDAVTDYRPQIGAEWACSTDALAPTAIICHGDFAPWNAVWRGGRPVGIIDWDLAHPGVPLDDVAYALVYCVPFRDDAHSMTRHAFSEPPDRRRRIRVFADAYGVDPAGLIDAAIARQWTYVAHIQHLHDRGLAVPWTTTASIRDAVGWARWSDANRQLFEP